MRQRRSGDQRREEILRAVVTLAAEGGFENLRVAHVARHVGVAPSALYRHFANKEAMLDATLDQLEAKVLENVESARARGRGALEVLERFLLLHVELVREHRGMPYLLFSNSMRTSSARRSRFLSFTMRLRSEVEKLLGEGQRTGQVRKDLDPQTGALMFVGTFLPPAILWNLSDGRFDFTQQVRHNWKFYRSAVSSPPARRLHSPRRRATKETPS